MKIQDILLHYHENHVLSGAVVDIQRAAIALENLNNFFGKKVLADISIPLCRKYGEKRGVNPSTIRRELAVLKAAFRHAYKWKLITLAEIPFVESPKENPPRERWLTEAEIQRLWQCADARIRAFIEIAYFTASRRVAIERLTWTQVDLENKRICLAKPNEIPTKKRRPTVPIDPHLEPTITKLFKFRTNDFVLGSPASVAYDFDKAVTKAGLKDVTPHTLRHSRATHLLQKGVPLHAVAQLLGDTMATVERIYGHHCTSYLGDVLARSTQIGS